MTAGPASAHDPSFHIAELTARLERQPERADLYWRRGEQYRALQRWDEAADDFHAAVRLDADFADAALALARTNLDRGRPDEAVLDVEAILARRPDAASVWLIYAQALEGADFSAQAASAYGDYLERAAAPGPEVYLQRARLLAEAGGDNPAEALRCLEDGIERLGGPVALTLEAIAIEDRMGRFDDAVRRIDGILVTANRKEPWLARKAALLAEAGRCTEAVATYRAALEQISALPQRLRRAASTDALRLEIERALAALVTARSDEPAARAAATGGSS